MTGTERAALRLALGLLRRSCDDPPECCDIATIGEVAGVIAMMEQSWDGPLSAALHGAQRYGRDWRLLRARLALLLRAVLRAEAGDRGLWWVGPQDRSRVEGAAGRHVPPRRPALVAGTGEEDVKNLRVTVSLGRHSGGAWRLEVDDADSRLRVLVVDDIDDASVARMLAHHMSETAFPARLNTSPDLGRTHECRTSLVPLVPRRARNDAAAAAYQAEAEAGNPGWTADREGWNSHRCEGGVYRVTLRRWVDAGPTGTP